MPADGEAESEREDECDEPEQRALQHPDRLAQHLRVLLQVAAGKEPEHGPPDDDGEQDEGELPGVEREEHGGRAMMSQGLGALGWRCAATYNGSNGA